MESYTHTNDERDKALTRAMKMARLFQTKHFDKVMNPVYNYAAEVLDHGQANVNEQEYKKQFTDACGKATTASAQLEDAEINWLWNYLKNYKKGLAEARDEYSAGIGW